MLLSVQQKYILSVLKQVKYIRLCQLYALTVEHYRPEGVQISQLRMDTMFRRYELERFHPSPNRQAAGGKCPHSHPCPPQSSG